MPGYSTEVFNLIQMRIMKHEIRIKSLGVSEKDLDTYDPVIIQALRNEQQLERAKLDEDLEIRKLLLEN